MSGKIQLMLGVGALGTAMIVGCPGMGITGTQVGGFSATPTNPDDFFLWEATFANLAEVEISQLAQSRSKNPAVLAYAQQMIADHTAAQEQVAGIAQQRGLVLPSVPDEAHRLLQEFMQQVTIPQLEQSYMSANVADHAKNLSRYEDQMLRTQDASIRAFAAGQVPILRAHFAAAMPINQSLAGGAGPCAGTTASGTTVTGGTSTGGTTIINTGGTSMGESTGGTQTRQ